MTGESNPNAHLLYKASFYKGLQWQHNQVVINCNLQFHYLFNWCQMMFRYSSRFNFDGACNMEFQRYNIKLSQIKSFFLSFNLSEQCDLRFCSKFSSVVRYSRFTLLLFNRFPVDEQYCQIKFESFGFTNKQVINQSIN